MGVPNPKMGQFQHLASLSTSHSDFRDLQGNNSKHPEASRAAAYCSLPHIQFREHISNR